MPSQRTLEPCLISFAVRFSLCPSYISSYLKHMRPRKVFTNSHSHMPHLKRLMKEHFHISSTMTLTMRPWGGFFFSFFTMFAKSFQLSISGSLLAAVAAGPCWLLLPLSFGMDLVQFCTVTTMVELEALSATAMDRCDGTRLLVTALVNVSLKIRLHCAPDS